MKRGTPILYLILLLGIIFSPQKSLGQRHLLYEFANQKNTLWMLEKRKADSLAKVLNIPIYYVEKDSNKVVVLQRLGHKNKPIYYATENLDAAETISVDQVWTSDNAYPSLNGEGVEINLWDGGAIRASHQELQNALGSRITMRDLELPLSSHSTHIAGTMIASGVNAAAKGMAGKATIKGWDLNDDIAEMSGAAADGIVVSNHSYGPLCGWDYNSFNESWYWFGDPEISATEDFEFGFYNQVSADLDYIAQLAPNYLIVKSAGNDRNDGPTTSFEHYVWDETWKLVNVERDLDGGTDGFDCLTPMAVAKNILTVGAVDDAKAMTLFSAFGPTDDGRIKPDVVANGSDVFSSVSTNDNSYASYNGTSMSAASVTGSAALLLQLQNTLQPGVKLLSSTIKGLLIHTAADLGNAGPDYRFGWGLLNIKEAADLIYDNSNNQGNNIYEEVLSNDGEFTIPVTTQSAPYLKVTICWTDPAGQASSPSLNSRNSKLVNDLNLLVENSNSLETYQPWVLDVENPAVAATQNINHIDNVEQIYLANPGVNNFDIKISHSGVLSGGSQKFSLIISGIETTANIFPPKNLTYTISGSSVLLNWDPPDSGTPELYKIYRNNELLAVTENNSFQDQSIVLDNFYEYYVTAEYELNDEKFESIGTNLIIVFPQTLRSLPYIVEFEQEPTEILIQNSLDGWQWGDSESLNCYYLDFSDNTTKFIGIDSYSAGEAIHVSDIAITAPLRLADYSNVTLSFDYLLKTGIYDAIDELHVVYKLQEESEWHELIELEASFNWTNYSLELPPDMCKNGTQIGFYYDDLYQWGMGAGLDNIQVLGTLNYSIDLVIESLISPVPACSLSENEVISISIQNIADQSAAVGDSIIINMNVSSGVIVIDTLILAETLSSGEIIAHQMSSTLDLSSAGTYTFEFAISSRFDNNDLNNSFEASVEVFGFPITQILNQDLDFCEDDEIVLIEVSPTGGTLSGNGVTEFYFDPAIAGVGTHTITYTYIDENSCADSIAKDIIVNPLPQPLILNQDLDFCEDDEVVLIEVSPTGGTLTGPGIIDLYFDPAAAGAGTHVITYTYIATNGCVATITEELFVNPLPQPAILNQNLSYCVTEEPVLMEVSPAGGTLAGPGVSGYYFNPQNAGIGTHTLIYTFIDANGCEGFVSEEVLVSSQPLITNQDVNFCEDDQPVLIQVSPSGGILTGPGISDLYFNPAIAGVGTHTITYTYTDDNSCAGSVSIELIVSPLPQVLILNQDLDFCEDDEVVLIEVSPTGGTLTGSGITDLYFDPAAAGAGTHVITYTYIAANGCVATITEDLFVNPLPQPAILNQNLSYCVTEEPVLMEVSPAGGTLAGTGVSDYYFNPQEAGEGTHTLIYTFIDANGCEGSVSKEVFVTSQTLITIHDVNFCEDDQPVLIQVSPSGGILTGPGISDLYFNPAIAGVGTHTITYTYTDDNSCAGSVSIELIVAALPQPSILNQDLTFCESELPVLIQVSPSGGILTGPGITDLYFDPSAAGAGPHLITYTYSVNNGCLATSESQIIVLEDPIVNLGPDQIINLEDTIHLKPLSNGFSFLWFDGSTEEHLTIHAQELGLGIYDIWVLATSIDYCSSIDSILLTIDVTDAVSSENNSLINPTVYPNPFKQGFYLSLDEEEKLINLYLIGQSGLIIMNNRPKTYPYFDVSDLKSGIYILNIHTSRRVFTLRILKI